MASSSTDHVLLLGRDHAEPGVLAVRTLAEGSVACALSAGSGGESPGAATKRHPNEDALLAVVRGEAVLLAVADAHYGLEASHFLLHRLAMETDARRLDDAAGIEQVLRRLGDRDLDPNHPSATTLLVAIHDRRTGHGRVWSWGDSTLTRIGPDGLTVLTQRNTAFVHPAWPDSLAIGPETRFDFQASTGGLLVAFTDGVDECHYGRPETSIRPEDQVALFRQTGPEPEAFVRRLGEMALAGVEGNPGGEDNLAIVAART